MTTFRLPKGARHLKMYDGTVYRSTGSYRNGRTVTVEDPAHARKIAEMGNVEGFVHVAVSSGSTLPGRQCGGCGFAAWKWQTTCPRCGGETKESA